jgi:hypothetical protein
MIGRTEPYKGEDYSFCFYNKSGVLLTNCVKLVKINPDGSFVVQQVYLERTVDYSLDKDWNDGKWTLEKYKDRIQKL